MLPLLLLLANAYSHAYAVGINVCEQPGGV
jgi:hypothetical protein